MLFFKANFICYYFYPTKKREEPLFLHDCMLPASIVISSGGFMRRLSRGVLFCPLHRGGKGTRFVRKQSDLRIV